MDFCTPDIFVMSQFKLHKLYNAEVEGEVLMNIEQVKPGGDLMAVTNQALSRIDRNITICLVRRL